MTKQVYAANWKKLDPEAKWGLPAKRFTGVNAVWAFFNGVVLTVIFYAALLPLWNMKSFQMVNMFFHGGPENRSFIPYVTVLLSMWCLAILLIKLKKIRVQRGKGLREAFLHRRSQSVHIPRDHLHLRSCSVSFVYQLL